MRIKDAFRHPYCVYTHTMGRHVIYVGAGTLSRAFSQSRTPLWHKLTKGRQITIQIVRWFDTKYDAYQFEAQLIVEHKPAGNQSAPHYTRHLGLGVQLKKNKPVVNRAIQCVETGIVYPTSRDAQHAFGVTQGAISNVLNGRSKSIRGFTFVRVKDKLFEHANFAG